MIRIKNNLSNTITALACTMACGASAIAQSSDALLDKLVEKGIINVKEANQLREDSDKDFAKSYSSKSGMPEWVRSMKLNGDFRGRFDEISGDNGPGGPVIATRDRLRYRLRFGATVNMTDDLEVGFRLGSGDAGTIAGQGSPFSGNTTMNNDASRKPVFIDLAYARYTPFKGAEVQFGKMQNLFWTSPMVFSPDYMPEGLQEKYSLPVAEKHTLSYAGGQWVVSESSGGPDSYLIANQIDWTAKWHKKFATRVGLSMYNFADQKAVGSTIETFVNQNGTPSSGSYTNANGKVYGAQNFNPIIARGEAVYTLDSFPLFTGEFPLTLSGEYANNPGANGLLANGKHQPYAGSQNIAYNVGLTLGSAKAKGNWQVGYTYKNIETASLWRGLMDDNFGFGGKGGSDVRGHLISASYKIFNPLTLSVSYFKTEQINNTPNLKNEQDRILVDLLWVF